MVSKKTYLSDGDDSSGKSIKLSTTWTRKGKKKDKPTGDEIETLKRSSEEENFVDENEYSGGEDAVETRLSSKGTASPENTRERTGMGSEDSSSGHENFVSLKDLLKIPRIEPNSRGNFLGSSYNYEKPISNFKLRIRLLKYPSLAQRAAWGENLLVLEDRVLSWQEKIFSKSEVQFLMDKKNVVTPLDERYRREILSNKESVGKYFYTYVESDLYMSGLEQRSLVHKCAARHSRKSRKFNGSTFDKSLNSDGESVLEEESDGDDYQRSLISKKNIFSREQSLLEILSPSAAENAENLSDETLRLLRKKKHDERMLKEKERVKKEAAEQSKLERDEKSKKEKDTKEAIKKAREELKSDRKLKKFKELERRKKEKDEEYMKMWAGSKRPSLALEAHMKLGMTPTKSPKIMKKRRQQLTRTSTVETKSKSVDSETEDGGWNTQDEEGDSYDGSPNKKRLPPTKRRKDPAGQRHASVDELEEILEPPDKRSSKRKKRVDLKRRGKRKQSEEEISDEDDENLDGKVGKGKKLAKPTYKYSQSRIVRSRSQPFWRRNRDYERVGGLKHLTESPQSMYIMVAIPHMTRRRRDLTVCSIKTYLKSGVVMLKPSFGYRVIEAKRNHMYRVSWELFKEQANQKATNYIRDIRQAESEVNVKAAKEEYLFGDIGDMFEVVPANEMRLVVMGEIVSAKGFEDWPICVHYIVEIPKGWRNDSVSSNLQGITHNSCTTSANVAHFSHDFFFQLALSLDSVDKNKTYSRPLILFMVASMASSTRVKYEGYGYITVPSQPGIHYVEIRTWRPKPRNIQEKMNKCFLNLNPSLQDVRAVHIPFFEDDECTRANRLGLETEASGLIKLRLNILHQNSTSFRDQNSKLELLQKMSSSTILRSVQAVIDAFQRARNRAIKVKTTTIIESKYNM